jgi:O-antigen ligase
LLAAGVLAPFYRTIERRLTRDDYRSAESRIPLNKAALSIIRQNPLLGVGLNNGSEVFRRYDTTGHARLLKERQVVHNLHLLVWMEVGTLGLAAFWAIFTGCFWVAGGVQKPVGWGAGVLVGVSAGCSPPLRPLRPGFKVAANV